jgi:hypothetical protein
MKKILLSLTAVAALAAAAAPAAAQSWRGQDSYAQRGYGGSQLSTGYVDALEWKIQNAVNEGRISRGEGRSLMAEFRQVQPLAWRVETGRASGWERQRLQRAVTRIDQAVSSYARYDRGGRDYGYGYGDYRRR